MPGWRLTIEEGTILEFENGIGMLVQVVIQNIRTITLNTRSSVMEVIYALLYISAIILNVMGMEPSTSIHQ